jgi:poly(ADP-ribose) glycohydrolase ARH3
VAVVLPTLDRFLGCLLGQAVGDGLGAPYEGMPADNLYWGYGPISEIIKNPTGATLHYTDDTQMMIGVAETLVEHGRIVEEALCIAFAGNYNPQRGYGRGARRILEAMIAGRPWRELTQTLFPGGSFGNGAAMRAAPIGLLFCHDLDRVVQEARLSALPTHVHPLGIEGAQLFALAVALAARTARFEKKAFYRELVRRSQTEEFQWQLRAAAKLGRRHTISFLGNGLEAHRSVVTAIACFTITPDSYEDVVARAIGMGDDTDTLAAMAGAISGAYLGMHVVPANLLDNLENAHKGRAYLEQLARRLYEKHVSVRATG